MSSANIDLVRQAFEHAAKICESGGEGTSATYAEACVQCAALIREESRRQHCSTLEAELAAKLQAVAAKAARRRFTGEPITGFGDLA